MPITKETKERIAQVIDWIDIEANEKALPESGETVLACNVYDKWMVMAIRKKTRWFNEWNANDKNAIPISPTHWAHLPPYPEALANYNSKPVK